MTMDPSAPPLASLGIRADLSVLVPFGNPCTVLEVNTPKGIVKNRRGYIVGYATDTAGYMVVFPGDDGRVSARSPVYPSVNVVPDRGLRPWVADGPGASRPPDTLPAAASDSGELPTREAARALVDQDVGPELLQRQVRVGAVPGGLGSRFSLLSKGEAASLPPGSALMTKAAAQAVILKAREDGATVVFDQTNPRRNRNIPVGVGA